MKIVAHIDPARLERELLDRLEAAREPGRIGRLLVVVPTARLADHVARRCGERRSAWLGLEILHFRALALRIAEPIGAHCRLLTPGLVDALAGRLLAERREDPWVRFVRQRPGARRRIGAALRELREAGVTPSELAACATRTARERALARLYRDYVEALEVLAGRGHVDEAGLVARVLPHAPRWAAARRIAFLHGAYELIGIHLDLLRAIDRGCQLTCLLPAGIRTPATAYASAFATRHLSPEETFEPLDGESLLGSLHDERARGAAHPERFAFRHAQGAAGEFEVASRHALEAVRDGCPPHEVAILARSLEPYSAVLERPFESGPYEPALPWSTSARAPLRRHPVVHDALRLLLTVAAGFPRAATAALLGSPRIRWQALVPDGRPISGVRAEVWSRRAGIVGGLDEWRDLLPRASRGPRERTRGGMPEVRPGTEGSLAADEARPERDAETEARRVVAALETLAARLEPRRPRSFGDHARRITELLGQILPPAEGEAAAALEALGLRIEELAAREHVLDERQPVAFSEAVARLEEAIDDAELPLGSADGAGIRVLDVMQARGLTFRRVYLIGMNAGTFPAARRDDPVLPEDLRQRLRQRTERPVASKSEGLGEERQLLALALGTATERVEVSWQRADESGRARSPSLFLREVARVALGRPELERLVRAPVAEHVPSHPGQRLEALARSPGLLAPEEEMLLAVLRCRGPAGSLGVAFPALAPGLALLRATESFEAGPAAFDGRIGATESETVWTASRIEALARCPLSYLFGHVLRVEPLALAVPALELGALEAGDRAHALLERVYSTLVAERAFEEPDRERLVARGRRLVRAVWPEVTEDLRRRIAPRAPGLWAALEEAWLAALERFVDDDLGRLAGEGCDALALEHEVEATLELAPSRSIRARGRFDRVLRGPRGMRIGDYKTGRIPSGDGITDLLRGRYPQLPLYRMLAGGEASVELLGVGPRHAGDDTARFAFDGFGSAERERGFVETLATLVDLTRRGAYPLLAGIHCDWCNWALACRRNHPPTEEREARAEDVADWRLIEKKTARKPLLDQARGEAEER